jgi:hypothetical protein
VCVRKCKIPHWCLGNPPLINIQFGKSSFGRDFPARHPLVEIVPSPGTVWCFPSFIFDSPPQRILEIYQAYWSRILPIFSKSTRLKSPEEWHVFDTGTNPSCHVLIGVNPSKPTWENHQTYFKWIQKSMGAVPHRLSRFGDQENK